MKRSIPMRVVGFGLAVTLLLAPATLRAQDSTTPEASPKPEAPAAKRSYDPARHVPTYFGQIGLTSAQKETIYKLQGKHLAKIEELEKQIAHLKAQTLSECEGVLTDTQKQMLAQRRKAASEKKKGPESARAERGAVKAAS